MLKSSSISVEAHVSLSRPTFLCRGPLFSVVTEFYHFLAFIIATENFFVATLVLPSTLDYVATRISFSPLFLCFSSGSCRDREFTSACFVCHDRNNLCNDRGCVALGCEFRLLCRDRIFFVATKVLP